MATSLRFAKDAGLYGTYSPLDTPLSPAYSTLSPGVKEIDIAATLEHVRDQRPGLVRSKVTVPPCLSLATSLPKHSLHDHHEETGNSLPLLHPPRSLLPSKFPAPSTPAMSPRADSEARFLLTLLPLALHRTSLSLR